MRRKIRYYSIVELLTVIAIGVLIMTLSMKFFNMGSRMCTDYAHKAEASLSVDALKKCWRSFALKSGNLRCVEKNRVDFDDGSFAAIEKDRLLFPSENGKKYFPLPHGVVASFGEEDVSGDLRLLTLTLYPCNGRKISSEHGKIRIVACIPVEKEERGK